MILSDRSIRSALQTGRLVVEPLDDGAVQPSSVDVRLAPHFRVFANHRYAMIDVRQEQPDLTDLVEVPLGEPFVLHPGEFVLGSTLERIALPDDLVARIEGKSSLARLGLVIHSTAGFVDAGFAGDVTLELSNVATLPILLYPGMRIAQFAFFQLDTPAEHPYGSRAPGSKYQGQQGPTASRYHLNRIRDPRDPA
ncbi:dCTP deaminase [Egicoccus halophilus]|uniref:dCTP deaminase, dUMP-forming n=1 Tax=Egicoccus halophilus TaxID=1670830 RepID=A0A8J3A7E8_9ACTN|nr:dCTP deaminase [Egicoccus halophilus]GGI03313.1 dCTP deaminase [Egicoccus halophilus]